jgi:hypothetical protein
MVEKISPRWSSPRRKLSRRELLLNFNSMPILALWDARVDFGLWLTRLRHPKQ